jgi:uncharacterized protein YukE
LTLDDTHAEILRDVLALRGEVQGLRGRFMSLKDHQLLTNKVVCNSESEFEYHAPALSAAIRQGKFSTAIKVFQSQNEANHNEMSTLKTRFTGRALSGFSSETDRCRRELTAMRQNIAESEAEVMNIRSRIESIRSECPRQSFVDQRLKIRLLEAAVEELVVANSKLKDQFDALKRGRCPDRY